MNTIATIFNNSIYNLPVSEFIFQYLTPITVFFVSLISIKLSKTFITIRINTLAKKTKTQVDDLVVKILKVFNFPFYLIVSILISIQFSSLFSNYIDYIHNIALVLGIFYTIQALKIVIGYIFDVYISKEVKATNTFKSFSNIVLYIIGIVIIIQNLGYDISTLIAGLGIGGVAIAFAIQNILSDIFSSFSIYLDKPFNEGDFIQIGQDSGTVKKIGVKSTRIITLQGEELVVSNKELTTSRVRNYKQMKKRRVSFNVGIVYETKYEKILRTKDILSNIFTTIENIELDRVTLLDLASDNINFEIVYFINNQDYNLYMNIQESINLKILEEFAKNKIELAYPTQKVFVAK